VDVRKSPSKEFHAVTSKQWWEKPFGIVLLAIVASVVAGVLLRVIGPFVNRPSDSPAIQVSGKPEVAPASGTTGEHTPPPKLKPETKKPTTKIEQHGSASGAVGGSIQQGPCSNVQIGGTNNTATTNCAPQLRVPLEKIKPLAGLLGAYRGSVSVRGDNADGVTLRDATNLLSAFALAQSWSTAGVNQVIHGTDIGADGLPVPSPTGIHIYARSERMTLAKSVQAALASVGVKSSVEPPESAMSYDLDILVGAQE
jgi:hypothetical protein